MTGGTEKQRFDENPLISIVIPTYNRADTIGRALRSALTQTYDNVEILVVDDGSTDDTKAVVAGFDDDRVRFIASAINKGAAAARNRGASEARGEYVAFLDSDDAWRPEKLSIQVDALNAHPDCDVCFCAQKRMNYSGSFRTTHPNIDAGIVPTNILVSRSVVGPPTLLVRREVCRENPFDEDLSNLEDYEWVVRVSQRHRFYFVKEELVDVFLSGDSISTKGHEEHAGNYALILTRNEAVFSEYPSAKVNVINSIAWHRAAIGEHTAGLLREAFRLQPGPVTLVKLALSQMRLYPAIAKLLYGKLFLSSGSKD